MKKSLIFIASLLCILFISCSKSAGNNAVKYEDFEYAIPEENTVLNSGITMSSTRKAAVNNDIVDMDAAYKMEDSIEVPESGVERKLIKNGYVCINVPSFDSIEMQIQNYAKLYGGYITNTYLSENNYSAEIKIPSVNFENAMNNAGTLGEVKNRSQNANDVTEEFYDLETRINTKRILKDKLEGYLKQAASVKELLEIERQLNNVVTELESMEGRMKRLSNQIEYSTITINAYLPTGFVDTGYNWPDIKEDFRKMGVNIVHFLEGLLVVAVYLVIYGIPLIAICALLYWLLFGKIGLLIKLFKKISRK